MFATLACSTSAPVSVQSEINVEMEICFDNDY